MRRRMLAENVLPLDNNLLIGNAGESRYVPIDIPDDLKDYADELRLLKGVPLTYLLSDVSELSEESIRFFFLDINWTDALLDGAFSVGRVCTQDYAADRYVLMETGKGREYLQTPRIRRMHSNHKNSMIRLFDAHDANVDYTKVSGFILRSKLVNKMKGLHLYGYDKSGAPKSNGDEGVPLRILRMETIADSIMLCLFCGEIYEILIEEPKTGMRFGVSSVDISGNKISRSIDLRSAQEDSTMGKRIDSLCIDEFTDDNGRLHASKLAEAVGTELKKCGKLGADNISPSRFAFEMIAVAHRAKFVSVKE